MTQDIQKRITELLGGLMASPQAYVHDIDWQKGTALIVEADHKVFTEAIFLDNRLLGAVKIGAHVPLRHLLQELDKVKTRPPKCRFIFHTGHVGSTLVSRLLDDLPGLMGLREPLLLRYASIVLNDVRSGKVQGGQTALDLNLKRIYRLLARTFPTHPTVIIKATSICNNLATRLLEFHADNCAIGLYVGLETMLANMLMKNESEDLYGFVNSRLRGLKTHFPNLKIAPESLSLAELITVSWTAEIYEMYLTMTGPEAAKIRFINFDAFLAEPNKGIASVLAGLSLADDPEIVKKLQKSEVFSSYAKKPGFKYKPADRAVNLEESRLKNKADIASGLDYATGLSKQFPDLKNAFEYFGSYRSIQ